MEVGVSMWSFHRSAYSGKLDVPSFIKLVRQFNISYIELLNVFWKSKDEIDLAKKISDENGLKISAYDIDNDLVQSSHEKRKEQITKIIEGVNVALKLNAPVVRVFGGELKEDIKREDAIKMIIEGLKEGADYAYEHGIKLALENHGELYGTGKQLEYIVKAVNSKALGLNFDMGNFLLSGDNAINAIKIVGKYIYHVHLKDFKSNGEEAEFLSINGKKYTCVGPGEGETNFIEFLNELKKVNYDGVLSIENEKKGDELENTKDMVSKVKNYLTKLS
ncbi:MAG: sugar phosphate isomerase/epimerase family protein [Thermoproteota archaeon]|nr:sugar phosphate isomerase/epimerase [Candidatus Brockarchaeota archaeon]MBO3763212.1 sugar phosphate isomerase/epimerase [Candidatus Brockarchaeota archaeon]MBO3768127.1 sugar phosphate isomerase/epimerase [Candidatus Brockarchaeota archaeon]MBO3800889.1 sugar phosphate isomerase/epimerase [Candidatus Brockarchaeota archaeon]